ncbi:MAG: hypothetical protein V4685_09975 [Bacteroidota bacterium]
MDSISLFFRRKRIGSGWQARRNSWYFLRGLEKDRDENLRYKWKQGACF